MAKNKKKDQERERRIELEIVPDAHDSEERAMGWFSYLEEKLNFPFTAKCITRRASSPLKVNDQVDVIGMAPEEECEHEMFVMMRWEKDGLAVPLSQLQPLDGGEETVRAIEDWHYWIKQGV